MRYTAEMLVDFVQEQCGVESFHPDSDIFIDAGIDGDDLHELIEAYVKRYGVDMKHYLWYFHWNEEGGTSIGGALFSPPYQRVKRIPVTPAMLAAFANSGSWDVVYPEHKLPKYRYDIMINWLVVAVVAGIAISLYLRS